MLPSGLRREQSLGDLLEPQVLFSSSLKKAAAATVGAGKNGTCRASVALSVSVQRLVAGQSSDVALLRRKRSSLLFSVLLVSLFSLPALSDII
eukprot:COSAG02_NODE_7357_length_3048_cov_2.695901_2_plen_93_part_00